MKTRAIASVAMIVAASLSVPVFAESGAYIGTSIGQTKINIHTVGNIDVKDDKDTSWKFYAGYNFNQHVALEVSYRDFGEAKLEGSGVKVSVGATGYSASVLGKVPVSDNFSLFGRLGYAHVSFDAKARGWSDEVSTNEAIYGLGMDYSMTDNLSLRAEWERINNDTGLNTLSAGVAYNF